MMRNKIFTVSQNTSHKTFATSEGKKSNFKSIKLGRHLLNQMIKIMSPVTEQINTTYLLI